METQFGSNKGVEVFVAHGYRDILCRCVEWDFPTTHSILEELTELLFDRVSNCLHSSSELIPNLFYTSARRFDVISPRESKLHERVSLSCPRKCYK